MTFPKLTLINQKSKLDNLTLYETIDVSILDKLINSDLLKDSFRNPSAKFLYSNERKQLVAYKKLISMGKAKITYKRVEGMTYGRCNPLRALGLFPIRREIRHTLSKNYYTDIDIENCHPVILLQVCKKYKTPDNGLEYDNLEDYVDNRAKYLKEVMDTYNVDRDQAKRLFIILLYFGSFEKWAEECGIEPSEKPATKNIKNFKKELHDIGKFILDNNDALVEEIEKRKDDEMVREYNKKGAVVSYYLQEIECRCLEQIYLYCCKKNLIPSDSDCVLCADGIMIPTPYYRESLLTEFSKVINDKLGLVLKFTTKEMDQDYLSILDEHIITEVQIVKRELNGYNIDLDFDKNTDFNIHTLTDYFFSDLEQLGSEKYIEYFKWTNSFKYFDYYHAHFYVSNKLHKIYKSSIIEYPNFSHTFQELIFTSGEKGNKKKFHFPTMYLECKDKKKYSSFEFMPNSLEVGDKYNLFSGFIYDNPDNNNSYDMDIVKTFTNHIEYICQEENLEDKPISNYLLNWFSHIIQKPEEKTKVAIVLFSLTEGVGKNIISDIFSELLQGYSASFRDTSALTDKFNGEMMGKLFVVGDEINGRAQEIANELKNIIARPKENIEFKGKDRFELNDYKNYFFTTNNENVFKVADTDRRFMFIECPENKRSREYYVELFEFKKNKDKMKHLFNFLKSRDIFEFDPSKIVSTDYKKRLIMANLPSFIRFIKDNYEYISYRKSSKKVSNPLDDGVIDSSYSDNGFRRTLDLYKESIEYAKRNKLNSTYTEKLFSSQLKKIFGDYAKMNKERQSGYAFPFEDFDKVNELIEKHFIN